MVSIIGILPMMVAVYRALPCSAENAPAEAPWKDMNLKDNETIMIAQQAMDFANNRGFQYQYVLEVRSAKFSEEGDKHYYILTYTTVPAYCTTSAPFVREKCKPLDYLASDECTAYMLMVPKEEFVQVTRMECHEIEPHDSHTRIKDE
nr:uncharacterized protein LOC126534065 [Dermacentor andersoni]